jgi:ABC-type amino acid transport substrate-binding protein
MNRVDLKIRELKNTGEYNEIYNKWFGKRFYNDGYEVSEFGDNF